MENAQGGVLWFDEDFDPRPVPPPPPEPEIIEQTFTAAELDLAREEAARDARETALRDAEASGKAEARRALDAIASELAAMRSEAAALAEESAEAVVRLLMDCFATSFPALTQRHGPEEAAALLRTVLPALRQEAKITVRVNPHMLADMTAEVSAFEHDLADHVRLLATDAVPMGDIRIDWNHGTAIRDARALWAEIENILAPAGLLSPKHTAKENAFVD